MPSANACWPRALRAGCGADAAGFARSVRRVHTNRTPTAHNGTGQHLHDKLLSTYLSNYYGVSGVLVKVLRHLSRTDWQRQPHVPRHKRRDEGSSEGAGASMP